VGYFGLVKPARNTPHPHFLKNEIFKDRQLF
jgi:hypothetical protein